MIRLEGPILLYALYGIMLGLISPNIFHTHVECLNTMNERQ